MILALKTDGPTTEMWLIEPGRKVDQPNLTWESGRNLADEILAKISGVLDAAHRSTLDLRGILIFSGPGSFTSLRIGHTVANALADSLQIPVVGARGDAWLSDGAKLLSETKPGHPALPFYGAEANITKPKA